MFSAFGSFSHHGLKMSQSSKLVFNKIKHIFKTNACENAFYHRSNSTEDQLVSILVQQLSQFEQLTKHGTTGGINIGKIDNHVTFNPFAYPVDDPFQLILFLPLLGLAYEYDSFGVSIYVHFVFSLNHSSFGEAML